MSLEKRIDALEKMAVLGQSANHNFMEILQETKILIDAFDVDLDDFGERIQQLENRLENLEEMGRQNVAVLNALVKIIESDMGRKRNDGGNSMAN